METVWFLKKWLRSQEGQLLLSLRGHKKWGQHWPEDAHMRIIFRVTVTYGKLYGFSKEQAEDNCNIRKTGIFLP